MRFVKLVVAVLAVSALSLFAGEVNGKWKASYSTPDGQTRESTFSFKAEGDKLTGTVASARGETPITDGKINGDDISFSVTRNFGGTERKMMYKGKVSGDELKLKVGMGERDFEMTAKRVPTS